MAERARLDDAAVARLLARLEETLGRLEHTPGPNATAALDAVAMLAEVYGEALARVMDRVPDGAALAGDELLEHLLVLHDIHPEPVEPRVRRALGGLAPGLRAHGVQVALDSVADGTVRVRVSGGCGSKTATVRQAVEQAVLAVAPEVERVEVSRAPATAVIPADSLFARGTGRPV